MLFDFCFVLNNIYDNMFGIGQTELYNHELVAGIVQRYLLLRHNHNSIELCPSSMYLLAGLRKREK